MFMLALRRGAIFLVALMVWGAPFAFSQNLAADQAYDQGLQAYEAGNFDQAFGIWTPLAEGGHPVAQYSLGKLYDRGGGAVERNPAKAAEWYARASAQGVSAAQNNLALMYAKGAGVKKDPERAAKLWQAAADRGHATAQYNLGLVYFNGDGITQNKALAAEWFERAARAGIADAQFVLGQLFRQGDPLEANDSAALAWYEEAEKRGHERARQQAENLRAQGVTPKTVSVASAKSPDNTQTAQAAAEAEAAAEAQAQAQAQAQAAAEAQAAAQAQAEAQAAAEAAQAQAEAEMQAKAQAEAQAEAQAAAEAAQQAAATAAAAQQESSTQTAAVPAAGGRFQVWLASSKRQSDANAIWEAASKGHPQVLGRLTGQVVRSEAGGGVFYRVMAGPLGSSAEAQDVCSRLQAEEQEAFCLVRSK